MICRILIILIIQLTIFGCSQPSDTLFVLIPPSDSGINFVNTVEEKDTINILTVQYMYHGGAVAIGDFNNDSMMDIFFSGNMVSNRLYLNRGALKFEDITEHSGIGAVGKWNSGVALADVNADGLLDIYVCATISDDSTRRSNSLFINQGLDGKGVPSFKDEAAAFGVDDKGYSQNAAFFDYDKDGDLDLYVLTNLESDKIPSNYRPRILDGSALNNDRLYRNNGNNTFSDVTKSAGILIEGYGLGIGIADINNDDWPDIYIGNDYVSNDVLYINNQDGTFTNEIKHRLKHQSLFSMGVDISDVDNDLYPDIMTLDMLPENNLRRKTVSGAGATYFTYINNLEFGYEFQYMRNMLHANNGDGTFREIGQMAGVHQTEWSWSSLFMDVDNDGLRDLMITNGFPKDVTDKDYVMFKRETGVFNHQRSLIDSIPVLKVPNYAFKNNGNFSFEDVTEKWGLKIPSFSNGAAFADLDNDGDLDYVVNNINDNAFLYENKLYSGKQEKSTSNFIRIKLKGVRENPAGLGAKVFIHHDGKAQTQDFSTYRGYLSTMEDIIHFGIGTSSKVDTITVHWPDGKVQQVLNSKANQVLVLDHHNASDVSNNRQTPVTNAYFREVTKALGITYKHREWDKIDFYRQRTLHHKFSQSGPSLAVGDVNGDYLEDFIVGGSSLYNATIFVQKPDGTFSSNELLKRSETKSEDEGLLLFDADADADLDLYVVSGSYEGEAGDDRYQDRLYLNDGRGGFVHTPQALPNTLSSGSCVRACDIDQDGDLDLFIGGRVVSGAYPTAPESYLLRNDHGKFTDITNDISPTLKTIGMVTDALWSDFDDDGQTDLIVVGEFMPITFFKNDKGKLTLHSSSGIDKYVGWWNSIVGADFDRDGDIDYVAGNLGLNNYYNITEKTPLSVYAKDFDSNGSIDAIMSCYFLSEDGRKLEYPAHFWDELNSQSPKFRNQFSSYKQYGSTSMEKLLLPYDTSAMLTLRANYSKTAYIENSGGHFELKELPTDIQVAPVNGMVAMDVNNDDLVDVMMIGNDYGNEVFSGRYDAFTGGLLLGDGKGGFSSVRPSKSGFKVDGDAKALARIKSAQGGDLIIAAQNLDTLRIFRSNGKGGMKTFEPEPDDSWALIEFPDGRKQRIEFYYGSGYLSQSTRTISLPTGASKIAIFNQSGTKRELDPNKLAASAHAKLKR